MVGDGGESKLGEQHTIIGVDINAYSYFHEYNNKKKKTNYRQRAVFID